MIRVVAVLSCVLFASVGAARAAVLPSIYVEYSDDCVFSLHADGGIGISATSAPGTTIPPGSYQVVLRVPQDAPSCPLEFQLLGPGVQLRWDFGGEAIPAQATEVLQPGATYVATDLRNPARYRAVFTTATSGSSSSLVTQPAPTSGGKGEASQDLVGSARLAYLGVVTLDVGGRVRRHGVAVHSLAAGSYDVAVVDTSKRAGTTVLKPNKTLVTLTTRAFVGRKTTRLTLRPGTWRFAAGGRTATVTVS
jgi:hypothetical protein